MATASITAKAGGIKTNVMAEAIAPTGMLIFQSEARVANRINKKLEAEIKAQVRSKEVKVPADKEKIKS